MNVYTQTYSTQFVLLSTLQNCFCFGKKTQQLKEIKINEQQEESTNTTLTLMRRSRRRKIWEQGKRGRKSCFFLNSLYRPSRKLFKSGTETESESRWEILHARAPLPCRSVRSLAPCTCTPAKAFTLFVNEKNTFTRGAVSYGILSKRSVRARLRGKLCSRGTGHVPGPAFGLRPSGADPGRPG